MKHPSTLRLYRCWAALKGRTQAPARADLRPHLLGSAMLDIFTLRHDSFVFGYAGSRFRAGFSTTLEGLDFSSVWRSEDQVDMLRLLHGIVAHCRPVLIGARRAAGRRGSEPAEILLLPTVENSGEIGIVGALAATQDWIATARDNAELALTAVSTPEQALAQETVSSASQQSTIRPLRPRLLAAAAPIMPVLVEIPLR